MKVRLLRTAQATRSTTRSVVRPPSLPESLGPERTNTQDFAEKIERAARFGHNLARFSVSSRREPNSAMVPFSPSAETGPAIQLARGKKEQKDQDSLQKLKSGKVTIDDGQRKLLLCSSDKAVEEQRIDPKAFRLDLQKSLEDAVPRPEAAPDQINLLAAHAARIGQTDPKQNVIINCKSGKTRTPVTVISYLILQGKSPQEAIKTVSEAFKNQRKGVGIDYDSKLTGNRILDEKGNYVKKAPLLTDLESRYSSNHPTTPQEWAEFAKTAQDKSIERGKGKRLTPLWRQLNKQYPIREDFPVSNSSGLSLSLPEQIPQTTELEKAREIDFPQTMPPQEITPPEVPLELSGGQARHRRALRLQGITKPAHRMSRRRKAKSEAKKRIRTLYDEHLV